MKTSNFCKLYLSLALSVLVIFNGFGQKVNKTNKVPSTHTQKLKKKPIPYQKIIDLNRAFLATHDSDIKVDDHLIIPAGNINSILDDRNISFIVAIIVLHGHKLNIELVGSNKAGDAVAQQPSSVVKNDHKALRKKLKRRIPFNLNDFPIVIKMKRDGFDRLRSATECQSYLFYPGLEDGWEDQPGTTERHFTFSVLASEKANDNVNTMHTNTLTALKGEETWPRTSFTMAKNPSGGIIIPGTDP